jgi:hypothetical protein
MTMWGKHECAENYHMIIRCYSWATFSAVCLSQTRHLSSTLHRLCKICRICAGGGRQCMREVRMVTHSDPQSWGIQSVEFNPGVIDLEMKITPSTWKSGINSIRSLLYILEWLSLGSRDFFVICFSYLNFTLISYTKYQRILSVSLGS